MSKKVIIVIVVSIILVSSLVAVTTLPALTKHNLVPIPASDTQRVQTGIDQYYPKTEEIALTAYANNTWQSYETVIPSGAPGEPDMLYTDWYFYFNCGPDITWNLSVHNQYDMLIYEASGLVSDFNWTPTIQQKQNTALYHFYINNTSDVGGMLYISQVFNYPVFENVTYTSWLILYI